MTEELPTLREVCGYIIVMYYDYELRGGLMGSVRASCMRGLGSTLGGGSIGRRALSVVRQS